MTPIYKPGGRALEYADYALNVFDTCNHGCTYCYARKHYERFHGKGSFSKTPEPRPGLLEALEEQLKGGKYAGKLIHLCFSCDPYPAPPVDTTITREVIQMLKAHGCHVQILTKGGTRAERDFDLLDGEDWFGITISSYAIVGLEPNAPIPIERVDGIYKAKKRGINTWISCEPVIRPRDILHLISANIIAPYIDLYRIGKLNHYPSDINWGEFGRECERLAKLYGRNIRLKEDLQREMEQNDLP